MTPRGVQLRRHWRGLAIAGFLGLVVLAGTGWALAQDSSGPQTRSRPVAGSARLVPESTTTTPATTSTTTTVATTRPPAVTTPDPAPTAAADSLFAVGTTQVTLVDVSRPGPARGDTAESPARQLVVTIYYPIGHSPIGHSPSGGTPGPGNSADAAAAPGTFPLVVFAHGFNASADTYEVLEHDLAAGGFVVAAPDFPLSSSAFAGPPEADIEEQARDVSFVITSFRTDAALPTVLSGHVSSTSVGVVGHSDGGTTAADVVGNSCCADARIGAAAVLSGEQGHDGTQWSAAGGPPLLVVQGTADVVNPPSLSQQLFDGATARKLYVTITGGTHLVPYTSGPERGAISTLVVDFLRAALEDERVFAKVLTDANVAGVLMLAASAL